MGSIGTIKSVAVSKTAISETSTGGKIIQEGVGNWYGETDNGYAVSILDGGREDINLYRYGSKQIYELRKYNTDGTRNGETEYYPTKREATAKAKDYLKNHS